jgi:hypothetical protein
MSYDPVPKESEVLETQGRISRVWHQFLYKNFSLFDDRITELEAGGGGGGSCDLTDVETKLDSLLTELQLKADLSETQPVSIASTVNVSVVSGTISVGTIDLEEVAGTATAVNTGNANAGTQRVVLASDQPPVDATQSGVWNITNVTGTISLPTNASTDTLQGTINTSIQSVLTELALKADLSETQPVSLSSVPLASGAAIESKQDDAITRLSTIAANTTSLDGKDFSTAANQLPDGHNVTVDNVAATNPIPIQGNQAINAAVSGNPVLVCFRDLFGNAKVPTGVTTTGGLSITAMGVIPLDINENLQTFTALGEVYSLGSATANSKATARYLTVDSNGSLQIIGDVAHDAADSGNPLKIGGKASTGVAEPTAVANGDRTDAWFDEHGRQHIYDWAVRSAFTTLTDLNVDYDDASGTQEEESADVSCLGYRRGTLVYTIDSTSTPTRLQITVQGKVGSNYFNIVSDFISNFQYEDGATATAISETVNFDIGAYEEIRVVMGASGVSGTAYFTVSNCAVGFLS